MNTISETGSNKLSEFNISYKRGLDHNYLIIRYEGDTPTDYQINMLYENDIPGFLKLNVKNSNAGYDFNYEISSLQPIGRLFENKTISFDKLSNLLKGLIRCFKSAHEYLLDENNIILEPGLIYINVETHDLYLLLYPYYESDYNKSFLTLSEYILERADHSDSRCVMMSYNLFRIIKTGSFTIGDIEKLIQEIPGKETTEEIHPVKNTPPREESLSKKEPLPKEDSLPRIPVVPATKKKKSLLGNLLSKNRVPFNISRNNSVPLFDDDIPEKNNNFHDNKKIFESDSPNMFFENYEEEISTEFKDAYDDDNEEYGKTTLLNTENKSSGLSSHKLIYKEKGNEKVIDLCNLPLTVGKVKDCVDVVIKDPSVSRVHASLYTDNGKIMLKDLGSTNGTCLNGLILEEEKPIELEEGDVISFGKVTATYV